MKITNRFSRFLSVLFVAFLLSVVSAHANDGTSGSPAPAPAPAPAASAQPAAKARREDTEPKTFAEATEALKKARAERDDSDTKFAAEELAHGNTKALLKSTLEVANANKTALTTAETSLATRTQELSDEKTGHGKTKELLILAEAAAGLKPAASSQAVTVETTATTSGRTTTAYWEGKLKEATTHEARAKVAKDFEAAVKAGTVD